MNRLVFFAALIFCLLPWASPASALALGIGLALTVGNPFPQISRDAAKWLLQACVVLLGFSMNLHVVLEAGKSGMLFAAVSIFGTLILGYVTGRLLRINPKTSALITAGTAICGGSAIAAVGSVIGAAEGEMTVSMGAVFCLNAVALYAFPLIGHALHLSQTQFGTWAGIAIHDISSVVGASARYGLPALQTATAVKLARALWIVPLAFGAALVMGRSRRGITGAEIGFDPNQTPPEAHGKVQIPWFIGFFLLASVARSLVPAIADLSVPISHLATVGLTVTLFLIGSGISRATLQAVGWKPMVQGVGLWLTISAGSLWFILHTLR